ncbi:MAG: VPLPA-CTERM sorting domain-containing protein [Pseudomonadota bacterium]
MRIGILATMAVIAANLIGQADAATITFSPADGGQSTRMTLSGSLVSPVGGSTDFIIANNQIAFDLFTQNLAGGRNYTDGLGGLTAFVRGVDLGVSRVLIKSNGCCNDDFFLYAGSAGILPNDVIELGGSAILPLSFSNLVSEGEFRAFRTLGSVVTIEISDVAPVPLPAAAWMFLTGLSGLAWWRRRRTRAAVAAA